jgi:hypothetical protein
MAAPAYLLAPAGNLNFGGAPSGASYTSDSRGLVTVLNGSAADIAALVALGCMALYPAKQTPVTVSSLPLASIAGQRAFVSDSTAAAATNFGAVVAGSGSFTVPVWSDGSNWRIG